MEAASSKGKMKHLLLAIKIKRVENLKLLGG
jgi:hypothetical protein